jgi:hypothetical protein
VWAYWVSATGKVRSKETPQRKRAILGRLREGYSETDLMRAIDGFLSSEHHVEGNHLDLTLICRDGTKVEWGVERAGDVPAHRLSKEVTELDGRIRQLEDESMEALDAGATDRYQELQEQIRRIKNG